MRLFDYGPNERCAARKEEISHSGAFRGERFVARERAVDISKPKCEIPEAK